MTADRPPDESEGTPPKAPTGPDNRKGGIRDSEKSTAQEAIVLLAQSGMPLESGLRAAAEESDNRREAVRLVQLAEALERGESLESVMSSMYGLSETMQYLLAAQKTDQNCVLNLAEFLEAQTTYRHTVQGILRAVRYPLVVLFLTFLVFTYFQVIVSRPVQEMIEEFNISLPLAVSLSIWWANTGISFLVSLSTLAALLVLGMRYGVPREVRDRLLLGIPFFGSLFQWAAVSQFTRTSGLLLEAQAPLGEALRLSARSMGNAYLAKDVLSVAGQTEQGVALDKALRESAALPLTLVPWIQWGVRQDALGEGCRVAAQVFEERIRIRTQLLKTAFPPFVFLCIAFIMIILISNIMIPTFFFLQFA